MDKNISVGALAHVDAGKTTLAEQLLYKTNVIRKLGRVDHKDSFLDYDPIEREKGITIFNKEASFTYGDTSITYIDTPGHNDLRFETNHILKILDAAILIVAGNDQSFNSSKELYNSLEELNIPLFIFVNKMDIAYDNEQIILDRLHKDISNNCLRVEELQELSDSGLIDNLNKSLISHEVIPVIFGSALKDNNVDKLLDSIVKYTPIKKVSPVLNAYIYKQTSIGNERYAYLKVLSGTLNNKTVFDENNKVNEMYLVNGKDMKLVQSAVQGQVVAVKGLKTFTIGTYLPSLSNDLMLKDFETYLIISDTNAYMTFNTIKTLNDEMPDLNIRLHEDKVYINIEGQLLKDLIVGIVKERFNLNINFEKEVIEEEPLVEEEETIENEEHFVYQRMEISDDEVRRVFNNTYKPKERKLPANQKKKEEEENKYVPPKEILYLIDGYNLLHENKELEEIAKTNFIDAREKLINIVCDYIGYINGQAILIFDAYKKEETVSRVIERDNITIVYTKNGQTADEYIERKSKELADKYKVLVVTSDYLEQIRVFANGASRLSSREFYLRYENLKKTNKKIDTKPIKPLADLRKLLLEKVDD